MERETNSLQESGFTSLVALGCLGHREKLGWGGRPKALSGFPPSHGARLGAALEGVPTKTHRIVSRPCRHKVSVFCLGSASVPL